ERVVSLDVEEIADTVENFCNVRIVDRHGVQLLDSRLTPTVSSRQFAVWSEPALPGMLCEKVLLTSEGRLQSSKLPTADCRLPTANCQLPTADS
ncbi:MAG: hypothetical protein RBR09_07780, partial [Desulfobulbaceae bacterium]|nr:hypothetical protein [Desulfobulbaceae bacterium]